MVGVFCCCCLLTSIYPSTIHKSHYVLCVDCVLVLVFSQSKRRKTSTVCHRLHRRSFVRRRQGFMEPSILVDCMWQERDGCTLEFKSVRVLENSFFLVVGRRCLLLLLQLVHNIFYVRRVESGFGMR